MDYMAALQAFEATEANLVKAEAVWTKAYSLIPTGIAFGSDAEYERLARDYAALIQSLPLIDGWRPTAEPLALDDIAQHRLDAAEIGEISIEITLQRLIDEPAQQLAEYRYRLEHKRRQFVREPLRQSLDEAGRQLTLIASKIDEEAPSNTTVKGSEWDELTTSFDRIDTLLGSERRPPRWSDLRRHLYFGMKADLLDIVSMDWPSVREGVEAVLYGENEAVEVAVDSLDSLTTSPPTGSISTGLAWGNINAEGFERLIFQLVSHAEGYENAQWLMQTTAPDRGRDVSVDRVVPDSLSGTIGSA
ncbi:MAG: hypothetical protein ACXW3D_00055 [Caulobacteraceae bacterium]